MTKATLFFAECQGHRLAYKAYIHPTSDLQPVIWIHGLTGSVNFWEAAMFPEIYRERSWYSISLPLHFPSTFNGTPTKDSLSETLLADLIDAVVRKIPTGKVSIVGYSVGAFAALNYAAKYPDRVASIVSVGGFLTGKAKGIEGIVQFLARGTRLRKAAFHLAYRTLQLHPLVFKLATFAYARKWRRLASYPQLDPTIRNIFPDVRRHDPEGQRIWFYYLLKMNLLDETCVIDCPVLVIAGDKDPIIPFEHQVKYASLLPNAETLVLPGVGHVAFGESPDQFREAVLKWFSKHAG
ncbi:alpha/beta hydrolase [Neolewinella aurantiaca]|uniref:Alpha/beta hydrolase n=1 Tax=Neolewinella aurantiaca TaxID=2602767 RepID=A0A5C7G0H5_9BACT|nr:alpha/beta hydrolase [Neolewinella aurantiaca]TXF91185.1 alpha/beta hydrolase [Neolewinella aurantiaca]